MENYSLENANRNMTQNNIEKIKKSMKRLKDTINRSNSNNYKNLKINLQKHNKLNFIKNNSKDISKSYLYYNNISNDTLSNKEKTLISPHRNEYVNIKNKKLEKYKKSNYNNTNINNNTEFNLNKRFIDRSFYDQNNSNYNFNYNLTHTNENSGHIYSPLLPSRNKIKKEENNSKTDAYSNINLESDIINPPRLTDFSPYLLKDEDSLILNSINNNNYTSKEKNRIIRNKSAKQINIIHNLINNNNFKDFSNYSNILNTNESSFSNSNIFGSNKNRNRNEYENYLKNQIFIIDNVNKGLLMRYKNIITNYKSANEQNNLLMNRINEIKMKEKNIKNANIILENEYNNIKDKLFHKNNNEENNIINNNNNKIILKKENTELKHKIDKYDEIILQLRNQINKLIEESEKEKGKEKENYNSINDDEIINNLENKIDYSYKELTEQEKIIKKNKSECEQLLLDIEGMGKKSEENGNDQIDINEDNASIKEINNDKNIYIKYINDLKKDINYINQQIEIFDKNNNKHNYSQVIQQNNQNFINDKKTNKSYDNII